MIERQTNPKISRVENKRERQTDSTTKDEREKQSEKIEKESAMKNRFGKEMVEAFEEMAAHIRGEREVESYEVEISPYEAGSSNGSVSSSKRACSTPSDDKP